MAEHPEPTHLGRYEIVRTLGKGAMGIVYEGRDPNINRRVAIKTARLDVMAASGMADEMMTRFLREAQAAGALNHPNIITIYDAGEEDGVAYIAMEFLEGGDLREFLDSRKRLGISEVVEIGATLCEALAAAHEQGIIHRDMKPANIMMPRTGPIKIADFGIAHVSDSNLTQEGALIGTPHYMSPEQFMGQKLDGRSDLFSVGVILYEMLTGEKPFTGEALSTVMHHVIKTDPVPPSELNFAVSDALSQVMVKAMSKRCNQRYRNGHVMAAALREALKENPDPNVLEGTPPVAADTMLSPQAMGELDPGATVATVLPADATVASQGEACAVPAAPGSQESLRAETVRGQLAAEGVSVPTLDDEDDAVEIKVTGRPAVYLAGAAALVGVLIVIAIALASQGGGDTPPDAAGTKSATTTPVAAGGNFMSTIDIKVVRVRTPEAYEAWIASDDFKTIRDQAEDVPAHVIVKNPETGQVIYEDHDYIDDGANPIKLPIHAPSVEVTVKVDGVDQKVLQHIAQRPGDDALPDFVVLEPR